jgi:hypothetical protein
MHTDTLFRTLVLADRFPLMPLARASAWGLEFQPIPNSAT